MSYDSLGVFFFFYICLNLISFSFNINLPMTHNISLCNVFNCTNNVLTCNIH